MKTMINSILNPIILTEIQLKLVVLGFKLSFATLKTIFIKICQKNSGKSDSSQKFYNYFQIEDLTRKLYNDNL